MTEFIESDTGVWIPDRKVALPCDPLPWMPFYWGDFLLAVQHLRADQERAFMRMLMHIWKSPNTSVPNDPQALRIITMLPPRRFKELFAPVLDLFLIENGRITHPALRAEKIKRLTNYTQKVLAGR